MEGTEGLDGLDSCEFVGNSVLLSEHVGYENCAHCLVFERFGVSLQPLFELFCGFKVDKEGCLVNLVHVVAELTPLTLFSVYPKHEQVTLVLQVKFQSRRRYFLHSNDFQRLSIFILLCHLNYFVLDIGQIENLVF